MNYKGKIKLLLFLCFYKNDSFFNEIVYNLSNCILFDKNTLLEL